MRLQLDLFQRVPSADREPEAPVYQKESSDPGEIIEGLCKMFNGQVVSVKVVYKNRTGCKGNEYLS